MTIPAISPRLNGLGLAANAVASQRAQHLLAQGRDIINLTVGEPDFDTPQFIKDAAIEAMRRGQTKYTATGGTVSLRMAIREKFKRENGLDFAPEQITVANGGKQIIHNAFAATLFPRDDVVIPAPAWSSFPDIAAFAGGVPVLAPCSAEAGFKLSPDTLDAVITPRTRWVVLNSPNNPTGAVYTPAELEALANVLRRHPGVLVLSDEIYEHVYFTAEPPASLTNVAPDLRDRILVVNGVSKTYAMTGWRVGYAAGPQALISAMTVVQGLTTSGACSIAQAAAETALNGDQSFVSLARSAYRDRRDALVEGLGKIEGIALVAPEGGFFALPDISALLGRKTPEGDVISSDVDFARFLLVGEGLAVVDGTSFGLPGHIRLSLAASTQIMTDAVQRIARAVAALA